MPTYEYRCECGEEFEEFQSITAEPVAQCPRCGNKARRQISASAGLIFKGSGFYITDYKKDGGKKAESSKPSAEKTESTKDTAPKTETKSSDSGASKASVKEKATAAGS